MLKCTKFDFGWGSAADPAGGAYSAPQTAGFGGRFAAGEGLCWGRRGKGGGEGEGGEVERRERDGPKLLLNQGPSEPCYATSHQSIPREEIWSQKGGQQDSKVSTTAAGRWRLRLKTELDGESGL